MQLIGHLYLTNMLEDNIMHDCITELLTEVCVSP